MKFVLIVGDGMADRPQAALGGRTPLGYLQPDAFQTIAGGRLGRLRTCPTSLPPGSDTAFLTLLGNDTEKVYTGRAPLEAAGLGMQVAPGETAFRLNLVSIGDAGYPDAQMRSHNGGGIDGEDAYRLITDLLRADAFRAVADKIGLRVQPTDTFRHVAVVPDARGAFQLTPPHDIVGATIGAYLPDGAMREAMRALQEASFRVLNGHPINVARRAKGLLPANSAWFWGAGTACALDDFTEKFGVRGHVVSAVPLVKGIARLGGLAAPDYPFATGLLDTGYEEKAEAALDALSAGADFALVHLEAPDEMSHDGSLENKLESIRRLNERTVKPLIRGLGKLGEHRVLLMPDHYTLLETRTHDATPVPYAIYDSRYPGTPAPFTEDACANLPILESGEVLLRRFFTVSRP